MAEFMLVLKREPTPRTEAMQNGIDFENLVTSIISGHDDPDNPWSWAAGQIAAIIHGGQLQFKARKAIKVRGMDVVLYGRSMPSKPGLSTISSSARAMSVESSIPAPSIPPICC